LSYWSLDSTIVTLENIASKANNENYAYLSKSSKIKHSVASAVSA